MAIKITPTVIPNWANILLDEIIADEGKSDWWIPKSSTHDIFETCFMKFVNGNLQYMRFANMIAHAIDTDPYWNPAFTKIREFCDYTRTITGEAGPWGRMCIWKMPPNSHILPHRDLYSYHGCVTRHLYYLSDMPLYVEISGQEVTVEQGLLHTFNPFEDEHELINRNDSDFYFLGFDTWDIGRLESLKMFSAKTPREYFA